jgi:hypothetical protein
MGERLLALDPKRRRFVEEYRVDWNAKQAAIRAGYSPKTATSTSRGQRPLRFRCSTSCLLTSPAATSAFTHVFVSL